MKKRNPYWKTLRFLGSKIVFSSKIYNRKKEKQKLKQTVRDKT
jgi:hypothetical protein